MIVRCWESEGSRWLGCVCLEASELRTFNCPRTHCAHSHFCSRALPGAIPWLKMMVLGIGGDVFFLSQCCLSCTQTVWALPLTSSSINSCNFWCSHARVEAEIRLCGKCCICTKRFYSNRIPWQKTVGHSPHPFSKNKWRGDLDGQDKYPRTQDASTKGWQEWLRQMLTCGACALVLEDACSPIWFRADEGKNWVLG